MDGYIGEETYWSRPANRIEWLLGVGCTGYQDPIINHFRRHILGQIGVDSVVRLSACHYTSADEIDMFLKATESIGRKSE